MAAQTPATTPTMKGVHAYAGYFRKRTKSHNILAVERFQDKTRHMIEFVVRTDNSPYGARDDKVRLFLDELDFSAALASHNRQEIKIKKYAHIIEGHILFDKLKNAYRR